MSYILLNFIMCVSDKLKRSGVPKVAHIPTTVRHV